MEGGGDMGNAAEVAEISKKKFKKKNIPKPKQCHWTSFGLILQFWCDIGRWEVSGGW